MILIINGVDMNEVEKIKEVILSHKDWLEECLAIGLFGSFARGDFRRGSDIDVFIIIEDDKWTKDTDMLWYRRMSDALSEFHRDVMPMVYTLSLLKEVPHWETLRMATDGIFFYDKGGIKEIFDAIVAEAKRVGLEEIEIDGVKVWMMTRPMKPGEIIEVKLK